MRAEVHTIQWELYCVRYDFETLRNCFEFPQIFCSFSQNEIYSVHLHGIKNS